jgi:hypothetical protein
VMHCAHHSHGVVACHDGGARNHTKGAMPPRIMVVRRCRDKHSSLAEQASGACIPDAPEGSHAQGNPLVGIRVCCFMRCWNAGRTFSVLQASVGSIPTQRCHRHVFDRLTLSCAILLSACSASDGQLVGHPVYSACERLRTAVPETVSAPLCLT